MSNESTDIDSWNGRDRLSGMIVKAQARQEYQDPLPGLLGSAGRSFQRATQTSSPVWFIDIRIAEFSDTEQTVTAPAKWFEQTKMPGNYTYDLERVLPVAVELVGDNSAAQLGPVTGTEANTYDTLDLALLTVQVGRIVYFFAVWVEYGKALDEAVALTKRTLGIEPLAFPPVEGIAYTPGPLFDRLPKLEAMPEGFTWGNDYTPCVGILSSAPCADGTPETATPIAGE